MDVEDDEGFNEQVDMTLGTIEPHMIGDQEIDVLDKLGQPLDINNILSVEIGHGQEPIMIEEEELQLQENEHRTDIRD